MRIPQVVRHACLLFAAAVLPSALSLAAEEAPRLFVVHQEIADPSRIADYEATTKEFVAALGQHKISSFPLNFEVVQLDDFSYFYVSPMTGGYADLGKIPQTFAEVAGKLGPEKFGDLMRRSGETYSSWNDLVILERGDLSYQPEKPRLKPEEHRAVRYELYYLKPGREAEAEEVCRAWAAIAKAKGLANGFTVYQAVLGNDLPALAVVSFGRSELDLATEQEGLRKALGADIETLYKKTWPLVRRFDVKIGTLRPDLSAPGAAGSKPAAP